MSERGRNFSKIPGRFLWKKTGAWGEVCLNELMSALGGTCGIRYLQKGEGEAV